MECRDHLSIDDMFAALAAARAMPNGSIDRCRALMVLVEQCPSFLPALLELGRQIQMLDGAEAADGDWPSLDEGGAFLSAAVQLSGRATEPLLEWAYFVDVVQDRALEAELLFQEAEERALRELEEAWIGLIKVYIERDKASEAEKTATRAAGVFPESAGIRELLEQSRTKPTS